MQLPNGSYINGKIVSEENMIYKDEAIRVITYKCFERVENEEEFRLHTKVVLVDDITGVTWIKDNDVYNKDTGIQIAFLKAKNKQTKKQIIQLQRDIKDRERQIKTSVFRNSFLSVIDGILLPIMPQNIVSCENRDQDMVKLGIEVYKNYLNNATIGKK